ncbi:MAG: hypothetical protein M4579_004903 [Chaenotheca gracillima]|nr:MAG: hypothetical protein M4579_004903 [Chaenotheca gracillima]
MNPDQGRGSAQAGRQPPRQHVENLSGRGSVRRAREGMPPMPMPIPVNARSGGVPPPPSSLPDQIIPPHGQGRTLAKPYTADRTPRQLAPPPMRGRAPGAGPYPNRRGNPGAIGASISRPSPPPQWPLQEGRAPAPRRQEGYQPQEEFGLRKGPAPQRPPRPSFVPSVPETSPTGNSGIQSADVGGRPPLEYWEDNFQRPQTALPSTSTTAYAPSTPSSRPSTSSSTVTIPDFPVPASHNSRKSGNPGPPSASRRGYSSYYSQGSFVTPIPEEAESQRSRGSGASSHVIPSSWGSGPLDYYLSAEAGDDYAEDQEIRDTVEDGRESRSTNDDEERTLVRKASMGKRHKPSLTTIKSTDRAERDAGGSSKTPTMLESSSEDMSEDAVRHGNSGVDGPLPAAPTPTSRNASGSASPRPGSSRGGIKGFLRPQSSTESLPKQSNALGADLPSARPIGKSRSPLRSPIESRFSKMFGIGEKRNSTNPETSPEQVSPGSQSPMRRPPRLDIDAVREAEARGSLTSLPDLILRATKLAAVLDKGRPTSRWESKSPGEDLDEKGFSPRRRSGSISDMLASFPSPGLNSPREGAGSRQNRSRSPFANSALAFGEKPDDDSDARRNRRRKCCGMTIPVLILVLLLILVIVAAAVVLPVVFVVLPRQNQAPTGNSALAQCERTLQCMNGGKNVADGKSCRCLCVGGYTGDRCTTVADNGCVTTNINGGGRNFDDATLGSSIPRLLQQSEQNFSIPLNSSVLLTQFSASNLSCSSENALVTFDGRSTRVSTRSAPVLLRSFVRAKRGTKVYADAVVTRTASPEPAAATSNGIVFAPPTPTAASGSAPSSTPTSSMVIDENSLDFARVCILYILQRTTLDRAVTAQQDLQEFLQQTQRSGNATVGNGITVDFSKLTIDMGNGTVGGGPKKPSTTAVSSS